MFGFLGLIHATHGWLLENGAGMALLVEGIGWEVTLPCVAVVPANHIRGVRPLSSWRALVDGATNLGFEDFGDCIPYLTGPVDWFGWCDGDGAHYWQAGPAKLPSWGTI